MSEDAAPYFVGLLAQDYCATCGERLVVLPTGGRAACHPNEAMYWSSVEPEPRDARNFARMTGLYPRTQKEWYDLTTGFRISHAPLFLYRRVP